MPEPETFVSPTPSDSGVVYQLKTRIAELEAELEKARAWVEAEPARIAAAVAAAVAETKGGFHSIVVGIFAKLGFHHREAVVKANESLGLHPQTPEDVAGPHGR